MSAFLGIDVSKATLDVCLIRDDGGVEQPQPFANHDGGIQQLCTWLIQQCHDEVHVCMEATGHYWSQVARRLLEAGYKVSVVNPLQIKAFRDTALSRGKSDAQDARLIAQFCYLHRPAPWIPFDAAQDQLKQLCRRRQALLKMRQQERNRLQSGVTESWVIGSLERTIAFYTDEIAAIDSHIRQHLKQHPHLWHAYQLLQSIPGIGVHTAPLLLAEIRDIRAFDRANQLVAYAGLDPQPHQSGTSIHQPTRISKRGNARLRAALFLPAVVAKNRSDYFQAFVERMEKDGHCPMSIVTAVMRKLLHLVYGMLHSGLPFDPLYRQKLALAT